VFALPFGLVFPSASGGIAALELLPIIAGASGLLPKGGFDTPSVPLIEARAVAFCG